MTKLSSHNAFFGNRYPIAVAELQPGMIVEFTYRKDSVGKPETKRYTVMVVDPKFKRPQDKEFFTHAINLDIASRAALLDVARKTGATMANSTLEARMVRADKLIVEGTSRDFYQRTISNLISGQGKGSYRTFKTIRLQGIQIIDYIFPTYIDHYDPTADTEIRERRGDED